MRLQVFSVRRTARFVPTSRSGVAALLGVVAIGVVAAFAGTLVAVRGSYGGTVRSPTSVAKTVGGLHAGGASREVAELSTVVQSLYAAARAASGPVVDPDYVGLDAYATGDALAEVRELLQTRKEQHIGRRASRDQPPSTVRITSASIDGDHARASGCQVDSDELYDLDTGATLDDTVLFSDLVFHFVKTPVGWKVSEVEVSQSASGTACSVQ